MNGKPTIQEIRGIVLKHCAKLGAHQREELAKRIHDNFPQDANQRQQIAFLTSEINKVLPQ